MIRLTLDVADKKPPGAHHARWTVIMPQGTILAYCDTEKECDALIEFFNTLSRIARGGVV